MYHLHKTLSILEKLLVIGPGLLHSCNLVHTEFCLNIFLCLWSHATSPPQCILILFPMVHRLSYCEKQKFFWVELSLQLLPYF